MRTNCDCETWATTEKGQWKLVLFWKPFFFRGYLILRPFKIGTSWILSTPKITF